MPDRGPTKGDVIEHGLLIRINLTAISGTMLRVTREPAPLLRLTSPGASLEMLNVGGYCGVYWSEQARKEEKRKKKFGGN